MLQDVIKRQNSVAQGESVALHLPKMDRYVVCNMRGGIGKTSLVFNISYQTDDLLVVDTCPQCSLSTFYDQNYSTKEEISSKALIYPHIFSGMGSPSHIAKKVSASNHFFDGKRVFFVGSSQDLYMMPSLITSAISMAERLPGEQREVQIRSIVSALDVETKREMGELGVSKCLIDTSPFFAGATMLSWFSTDGLLIPVRTDKQSINSLELLIRTIQNPESDFNRYRGGYGVPKIQGVILTHCGWSTSRGARNMPNNQTQAYLQMIYDLVNRNISLFSTDNPDNHIFMLDDFLGSGRISSALSKPIAQLQPGESHRINQVKTEVNASVHKIQNELKHICNNIW